MFGSFPSVGLALAGLLLLSWVAAPSAHADSIGIADSSSFASTGVVSFSLEAESDGASAERLAPAEAIAAALMNETAIAAVLPSIVESPETEDGVQLEVELGLAPAGPMVFGGMGSLGGGGGGGGMLGAIGGASGVAGGGPGGGGGGSCGCRCSCFQPALLAVPVALAILLWQPWDDDDPFDPPPTLTRPPDGDPPDGETPPVPEPGSLVLVSAALIGILARRRRL